MFIQPLSCIFRTRRVEITHQTYFDSALNVSASLFFFFFLSVTVCRHPAAYYQKSKKKQKKTTSRREVPPKEALNSRQSDETLPHPAGNQSQSGSLCSRLARQESGGCTASACRSAKTCLCFARFIVPAQDGRYSAVQGDHSTEDGAAQTGVRAR